MKPKKVKRKNSLNSITILILVIVVLAVRQNVYAQGKGTAVDDAILDNAEPADSTGGGFNDSGLQFKLKGYYKDLLTYQKTDEYMGYSIFSSERKDLVSSLKRIRLSPELRYGEQLIVHIDYDNELILSSYNKSYEFDNYWRPAGYNNLMDLTWEPYYNRDIYYRTRVHRAYVKYSVHNITFTVGRQQIRFGSGRLWNPLDILNPVSPTYVEGADEQSGTDAVRIDYYFNAFTELTFAYNQNRYRNELDHLTLKDSNSVMRFKTTVNKTDYALLFGWVSRRMVIGTDLGIIFYDGILRGSVVYERSEDYNDFIIANAGYEYTLKNGIYLLAEYFYNSNDLNGNNELRQEVEMSLVTGINQDNYYRLSNQFLTYNSHYLGFAIGNDFHPLVRGDLFMIIDTAGEGLFINPSVKYNALENLDLETGFMAAIISESTEKLSDFEQYKKYPFVYFSLRYY